MPTDLNLRGELEKLRAFVESPRRRPTTWLVTAGQILRPPFTVSSAIRGGMLRATIRGRTGVLQISCNRIVTSSFRPGFLSWFTISPEDVVRDRRSLAALTDNFQRILKSFPPNSRFDTPTLYAKIKRLDGGTQAHARRRWKELKYDYGFDVDYEEGSSKSSKAMYWRGPSDVPINDPFIRPDDKKLRVALLPKFLATLPPGTHLTCSLCGRNISFPEVPDDGTDELDSEPGLLDHRRPILQGGDDTFENLQPICQTCNNKKGTACRRCAFSFRCNTCIWAYPENVRSRRVVLIFDNDTAERLRKRYGSEIENGITELVRRNM